MSQIQVQLGSLPIMLVLLSDGTLVFVRMASIGAIFDQPEDLDKVGAALYNDGFLLSDRNSSEEFYYNTVYYYKEIPILLKWLQQQKLTLPL